MRDEFWKDLYELDQFLGANFHQDVRAYFKTDEEVWADFARPVSKEALRKLAEKIEQFLERDPAEAFAMLTARLRSGGLHFKTMAEARAWMERCRDYMYERAAPEPPSIWMELDTLQEFLLAQPEELPLPEDACAAYSSRANAGDRCDLALQLDQFLKADPEDAGRGVAELARARGRAFADAAAVRAWIRRCRDHMWVAEGMPESH